MEKIENHGALLNTKYYLQFSYFLQRRSMIYLHLKHRILLRFFIMVSVTIFYYYYNKDIFNLSFNMIKCLIVTFNIFTVNIRCEDMATWKRDHFSHKDKTTFTL